MWEWLQGKKTYILAIAGILLVLLSTLVQALNGEPIDWQVVGEQIVGLLLAMTVRNAIANPGTNMKTILCVLSLGLVCGVAAAGQPPATSYKPACLFGCNCGKGGGTDPALLQQIGALRQELADLRRDFNASQAKQIESQEKRIDDLIARLPKEGPTREIPREVPVRDLPREAPVKDLPKEVPVKEIPKEPPTKELPKETPPVMPPAVPPTGLPKDEPKVREIPSGVPEIQAYTKANVPQWQPVKRR